MGGRSGIFHRVDGLAKQVQSHVHIAVLPGTDGLGKEVMKMLLGPGDVEGPFHALLLPLLHPGHRMLIGLRRLLILIHVHLPLLENIAIPVTEHPLEHRINRLLVDGIKERQILAGPGPRLQASGE
jgi:hypothetical protein